VSSSRGKSPENLRRQTMSFVSGKQRRYLFKNKPDVAKKFEEDELSRPAMKKKKRKYG